MKCRLDEEIDVEDVTVTWFFNDKEFTESDRVQITFDGTYAKVFIAGLVFFFFFPPHSFHICISQY